MKKSYFAFLLLALSCVTAFGQEEDYPYYKKDWQDTIPKQEVPVIEQRTKIRKYDEPGDLKGSISVGLGIISPDDVNNYIRNDLSSRGISIISGSSDMTSALMAGIQLYYVVTPKLQVKGIFDFAIGISSTELINQSDFVTYTATRISAGVGANYYFGAKRINPYIGGAIFFHALSFEGYKGTTVGPRAEPGVAFNFGERFKMEAFLQLDVAEASAEKLSQSMTIDFSSLNAGARFLFRL
ncbi:hypothetical protein C900_05296 [Fulvivirga imtechensis AK7]|uniref:Outer membrane protein beta-barrel domain-containing protein n=1 Tax=Fulvivirga imtechensis AK7 TaxID=1237149 RepID=L8JKA3_9BACT|nr:hypothetical protein [Fulvivirga imtechensis]ELR69225.1 hypothetical protein C900_05296 [Fulvivirga imtechensis AK7]